MKKIISIVLCIATALALCSCGAPQTRSYKEIEDYKKVSSNGYTIKYDDNTFDFVKADGSDSLVLKSSKGSDSGEALVTITKVSGNSVEEQAKAVEKSFGEKGFTEISTDHSTTIGGNALCVSALADEGEYIYESEIVPFDGGVYELSFHYSTSLENVAVSDAIYSIVSTFEVSQKK